MAPTHAILAQLEVEDCTAELYLNGVPLVRLEPRHVPISNVAVEDYLVGGDNRLELLVEPGAQPSVARSDLRKLPFRPMKAWARLLRIPDGEAGLAHYGEVLGETSYSWTQAPPDERDFPASSMTSVTMPASHGRWGWQDAPVLSQTSELFDEARAVLDAVETALRRGDRAMLMQLLEHRMNDWLRAYPAHSRGSMEAELAEMMRYVELTDDPVFERDPAQHDFRLVAGGRMLQLLDRDWQTSMGVRHHERGTRQPYRITLARLDGGLRILR
jgi:hypothetical protein